MATSQITEAEVKDLIKKLNLAPILLEIFDEQIVDEIAMDEFRKRISKPYSIFTLDSNEQEAYQVQRFIPIFEFGSDRIIAYDLENKGFINYSLEEGIQSPTLLTFEGVFLEEMIAMFENEVSESDIIHIGKLLGFKHTESIVEDYLESEDNDGLSTFEEMDAWTEKTLDKYHLKI